MIEEYSDGQISLRFDSMIDLFNDIDDAKIKGTQNSENNYIFEHSINWKAESYYGGDWVCKELKSFDDVLDKSVVGSDELVSKYLAPMISRLNQNNIDSENLTKLKRIRRKRVRKDFGDEIDIHLVNQGKLDIAWSTTEREEIDQEHHLVTLLINIGGTGDKDATQALWTAAATLLINDILQSAGKSVQIVVGNVSNSATKYGKTVDWTVVVKKYNEHLTLSRLAVMSNLSFYRTVGFSVKCLMGETVNPSMGYSREFSSGNLPSFIKDEIRAGNTKLLIIDKCLNYHQALSTIEKVNREF